MNVNQMNISVLISVRTQQLDMNVFVLFTVQF